MATTTASPDLVLHAPPLAGSPTALVLGDTDALQATPELVFAAAPAPGSPTHLVFGTELAVILPLTTVTATIALGPNTLNVQARIGKPLKVNAAITLAHTLTVAAAVAYDNRVTRYLGEPLGAPMQSGAAFEVQGATPWQTGLHRPGGTAMTHQTALHAHTHAAIAHAQGQAQHQRSACPWGAGDDRRTERTAAHQRATPHAQRRVAPWGLSTGRARTQPFSSQTGIPRLWDASAPWGNAARVLLWLAGIAGASLQRSGVHGAHMPWGLAGNPFAGRSTRPTPPTPPTPSPWNADLLFACPRTGALDLHLLFGQVCAGASAPALLAIYPARFYMTVHTITAVRLPDLTEVPLYEATLSADTGSYCWTLSASGPVDLFTLLAPVDGLPTRVQLTLDGLVWVFAVDALQRSASFGRASVRLSARSVSALIGAPTLRATLRTNTIDRNAQQLAEDALAGSGIALDWGITDWLVPAGAWSHNGTPLEAVQAIAQAAGGYLQSHRSAPTLQVRHPYAQRAGDLPGAPWGWATGAADVELATDALITEEIERRDAASLNAVYASGTTASGILALIKRTGSAADQLAPMVTDALITHTDAARQRGLSILGGAGAQYSVRLDLPVLTGVGQPGVLEIGQLVQVNASAPWRGRVRAVSVNAKRPSLRQSVSLERHLEPA